jgi:hypothetical protein
LKLSSERLIFKPLLSKFNLTATPRGDGVGWDDRDDGDFEFGGTATTFDVTQMSLGGEAVKAERS